MVFAELLRQGNSSNRQPLTADFPHCRNTTCTGGCGERCGTEFITSNSGDAFSPDASTPRTPLRDKPLPPHLRHDNLPPEIARWHRNMHQSAQTESCGACPSEEPSDLTGEALSDWRDLIAAVKPLHFDENGNPKPRVGPWTWAKDMALIIQYFGELRGDAAQVCT